MNLLYQIGEKIYEKTTTDCRNSRYAFTACTISTRVTSYFSAGSVPDGGQMAGQAPDMQMNGSSRNTSSSDTAQSADSSTSETETSSDSYASGFDPSQGENMSAMNGANGPGDAAGEKNVGELMLSIAGLLEVQL